MYFFNDTSEVYYFTLEKELSNFVMYYFCMLKTGFSGEIFSVFYKQVYWY